MRSRLQAVHVVERLEGMFPRAVRTAAALKAVLRATRSFDYPAFTEPKILLDASGAEPVIELDGDCLISWVAHMSHSSRARMELLEDAVLRSLAHSEVIAPATLVRAHIEAAAWAAYAYEELLKVAETGSWDRLKRLLPKMLYGTAIAREAKRLPPEHRDPFWIEPTSVMNAIDALDRFFAVTTGLPGGTLRVLYASLSDYAHPAIRGVRHLLDPTVETLEGWNITYSCDEHATAAEADFILKSLLTSIRFGHGAALLMRLGTLEEDGTEITYLKPHESDELEIKRHIIFGELPDDA